MTRFWHQLDVIQRILFVNALSWAATLSLQYSMQTKDGDFTPFYHEIIQFFSFSSAFFHNLTHPWSLVTASFVHQDWLTFLWNMVGIFWFGRVASERFLPIQLLWSYVLGGALFFLTFFLMRQFAFYQQGVPTYLTGAQGGMLSLLSAATCAAPNTLLKINFIGTIKLPIISIMLLILHLISLPATETLVISSISSIIFGSWFGTNHKIKIVNPKS